MENLIIDENLDIMNLRMMGGMGKMAKGGKGGMGKMAKGGKGGMGKMGKGGAKSKMSGGKSRGSS